VLLSQNLVPLLVFHFTLTKIACKKYRAILTVVWNAAMSQNQARDPASKPPRPLTAALSSSATLANATGSHARDRMSLKFCRERCG